KGYRPVVDGLSHGLGLLPRFRRRSAAREVHGLLIHKHHHDLSPGTLLIGGYDVSKAVAVVLAGHIIAARRADVRPVDLEVARAQAPLPVNGIRAGGTRADNERNTTQQRASHHSFFSIAASP